MALALILVGAQGCVLDWSDPGCWVPEQEAQCQARQVGGTSVRFCRVPAGCFMMGSPEGEPCREKGKDSGRERQHEVRLTRSFELSEAEITQAQFKKVTGFQWAAHRVAGNGCKASCCGAASCDHNPMEQITWHEAAALCNMLSPEADRCYDCTGIDAQAEANPNKIVCAVQAPYAGGKILDCPGYRLPTEAEWEYAYRAGTDTAYYSGANDPQQCAGVDPAADQIGWYGPSAVWRSNPVKGKKPNAWGLYDMAGNVNEWCHDDYAADLGASPEQDPVRLAGGSRKVTRGGGYYDDQLPAQHLRAAYRTSRMHHARWHHLGVRCARSLR